MTVYIALLRAVNVGGLKLPMAELKAMCVDAGFANVETYIASGNVVFESRSAAAKVKTQLEMRLHGYCGKPVGVVLRTGSEMQAVLKANPFPKAPPNFAYAVFLDRKPPKDALDSISGLGDEEIRLGDREIFVHYRNGMGKSKLKIPAARTGTARNMNTVAALATMAKSR